MYNKNTFLAVSFQRRKFARKLRVLREKTKMPFTPHLELLFLVVVVIRRDRRRVKY